MDYFPYRNGVQHAEVVSLHDIAEHYGTPSYVYSRAAITDTYREFDSAFGDHPHRICYAVKANPNLGVLSILNSLGASFDIVSGGELQRVLLAGAEASQVVFSGVGKQPWEIDAALRAGIACFNIESVQELFMVEQIARHLDVSAPVSIRVNPDVDAKTHPYISTGLKQNKFGVSESTAITLYRDAAASRHLNVVGIDCHIGSQILELKPFIDALAKVIQMVEQLEAEGIHLEHIDLGGGVGIRYRDEKTLDMAAYAGATLQTLGRHRHILMFEPGRFIVGNAGILLTRVILTKENEGKHFAVIDAAMNDLIRPALYQAWQNVSTVNESPVCKPESYDIVGPVCETGDFLAKDRLLAISGGDLLSIASAGAYGFTMSSNYNSRGRAAEVIVDGDHHQLVRDRESIEDQTRLEHLFKA